MRIDENGIFHFDAGGDVDPYFGIGSTTVTGQRLGGQNPADFIQGLIGDIGSTNVSAVGGGVGQYNPSAADLLLGDNPTYENLINYVTKTYNPDTTSLEQRKTAFDELMARYKVTVPAGAPPPESFLEPTTPVFIGQPTINIPGDSGGKAPIDRTTPTYKIPAGFTSQDILDYFSTPGLTPQEAVRTMQQYNVQPEDIASILGITPADARAQYNAALAPFAPVVTPPPTIVAPPVVDPTTAEQGADPYAFLQDYFNTPGLTPEAAVQRIKELGIRPEQAAAALGVSPEEARKQYDAVIAAQAAAVDEADTTPTTEEISEFINRPGVTPGEVIKAAVDLSLIHI